MTPTRARVAVLSTVSRSIRATVALLLATVAAGLSASAARVEFAFEVPARDGSPFARDLWADVTRPDGATRSYPAFYDGGNLWRVRIRATATGSYRRGAVTERSSTGAKPIDVVAVGPTEENWRDAPARAAVTVDRQHPGSFVASNGRPYLPLGLNLAWGEGDFYARSFALAEAAGLNWTRVWMASWTAADLDWLPPEKGPSPKPGWLSLDVARTWDRVLELAEQHGIYVQLVLQSHGQFSTEVNPQWSAHPWNRANGGFLARADEFFTSPEAIRHTQAKYRYVAARYGWSPAVLAWELFNEAHFTDAWKHVGRVDDIVRWHEAMAACLRAHDPHGHLVTTSADDLASPLWRAMDFYQPHLYAPNMLAHVRRFPRLPAKNDKPIFYGEIGDNELPFRTPADKASGAGLIPSVWAGLMADGALPAQPWYWDRLIGTPRWSELAAWAKFAAAARLPERFAGLRSFAPNVETNATVPHVLTAGHHWSLRAPLDLRVPTDGAEPPELADVPEYFVGTPFLVAEGRADRLTLRFDRRAPSQLRVHFTDAGSEGLTLEVQLNSQTVDRRTWPAYTKPQPDALRPADLTIALPAGPQALTLRNHGIDSFRLREIELGDEAPALAAIGKRSDRFAMLYLWHRAFVHSAEPGEPASGRVGLADTPPGEWTVTWWDMTAGRPAVTRKLRHTGGTLWLETPPIARHAAVFLEMLP